MFKWKDEPEHAPAKMNGRAGVEMRNLVVEMASLLGITFWVSVVFGSFWGDRSLSVAVSWENLGDLLVATCCGGGL